MTGPPIGASDPARWREVWQKALHARARGYSQAEINSATQDALGVDFPTLTRQLMGLENVADPEVQASPLAPFDAAQAAPADPGAAASFALSPLLGSTLGFAEHVSPTLREYGQMAGRTHPVASTLGRMAGSIVPALAMGKVIPTPAVEGALAPVGGMIRGAAQAAPFGLLASYGAQPSLTHPDLGAMAKQTAATTALGGGLGLLGDVGATLYNPAAQKIKMGIETSVPGSRFTVPAGVNALTDAPVADPVLERLMAERGNLATLATKYVRQSQPAAEQAMTIVKDRLAAVTDAKNAIAEHPTTGYDAILNQPIANPRAAEILKAAGREVPESGPTGRDVFSAYKVLRDKVQQQQNMIARGTAYVPKEQMHLAGQQAGELRDILGQEVPGFNDLQTKMQPYLDRESALRTLQVRLQGRGVYLKGKMPPPPPKGVTEKLREAAGLTGYFGGERAARSMVPALYQTSSPAGLLSHLEALEAAQRFPTLFPQFGTGVTAGLLGAPATQDRFGLLR